MPLTFQFKITLNYRKISICSYLSRILSKVFNGFIFFLNMSPCLPGGHSDDGIYSFDLFFTEDLFSIIGLFGIKITVTIILTNYQTVKHKCMNQFWPIICSIVHSHSLHMVCTSRCALLFGHDNVFSLFEEYYESEVTSICKTKQYIPAF